MDGGELHVIVDDDNVMLGITSQRQEIDMFGRSEDWPQDVHRVTGNNDIASVIFHMVEHKHSSGMKTGKRKRPR
ncbi:MAG: hypothetical protein QNK31_00845 [Porticoccus sp.]|nr:hypothetical protein [Porticoccus sp.]